MEGLQALFPGLQAHGKEDQGHETVPQGGKEPEDHNLKPREEGMAKVSLTPMQKKVFDIVLENAKEYKRTSYREILEKIKMNPTTLSKIFRGDPSDKIKGLYELIPPIKQWVSHRMSRADTAEVDVTFFWYGSDTAGKAGVAPVILRGNQKKVFDVILENAKKNQRMTLKEIAKMAGVSTATVSKALRGDATNNTKGLYELIPPIEEWVEYVRGWVKKVEVDVTFFQNHAVGNAGGQK